MAEDARPSPRTLAAVITALLLWASAFPGIRAGLHSYGPGQVALLRFGTASVVLGAFAVLTRMRMPERRDLPRIVLAGVVGITIYHVALNFGERTVPSGAAALIVASAPVFTALFAIRMLGEKFTGWGWAGVAASLVGVAVVSLASTGGVRVDPNALLVLLAAVSYALYAVVSKPGLKLYSAIEFTTYAIWAGTIPLLVFTPGLVQQMPHAAPSDTLAVVYLGIFPGAISYVLWSYGLARMQASTLSTFLYFQPANAAIIAWIWLGEVPGLLTVVGGVIAIAGVVIVNTLGSPKAPQLVADEVASEVGP